MQLDVRPGAWQNQLSVSATKNLPVAILGSAAFDVEQIDVATVELEGVPASSVTVKDVAISGGLCSAKEADGHPDLVLRFDTLTLLAALAPLPASSESRTVRLVGRLKPEFGGRQIRGQDILVLKVPK